MQISIIIPIYNVEPYIERCINSVIAQDFTDYEVILVDDKSPDNALQIAEKLLQENDIVFQSIQHPKNQGLSEARNSGIKVAKGKYIMFIDSDDELTHNEVLTQFYEAIEREQADFVCANHKVITNKHNEKNIDGISENKLLQHNEILEALLYIKISVSAWNKLINKEFLLKNDLFFQKNLMYEDDLWAFQMCSLTTKCFCLPEINYIYYRNIPTSITKQFSTKGTKDRVFVIEKKLQIMEEKQLCTAQNIGAFVFNYQKMAHYVLNGKLLTQDKQLWMESYSKIKQLYYQSELSQKKKLFRFPANIACFIRKEQRRNRQNNGSRFYRLILNVLHRYNGV